MRVVLRFQGGLGMGRKEQSQYIKNQKDLEHLIMRFSIRPQYNIFFEKIERLFTGTHFLSEDLIVNSLLIMRS